MKIVVLSDLHNGHKRLPGEHLYQNLVKYAYPQIEECDLLIFSGDIFHSLLDFNNVAAKYVIQFFNDIFYMSQKYKFGIRILRGTYSHDRNQVEYIKQSANKYLGEETINLKTYSDVSIDEESKGKENIKILYLPDDLPYKSQEEVLDTARKLLASRKWKDVDLIIGHGYCQHVLPLGAHGPSIVYTLDQLSSLCKHLAVFGHVHTPSVKKSKDLMVVYVGSFERMNHGEEEAKGFITIDTATWSTTFCTNKNTLKFLTFFSTETDVEKVIESFKKWIVDSHLDTKKTNYIRVSHPDADIRQLLGKILKSEFGEYKCVYSTKIPKTQINVEEQTILTSEDTLVVPTEDNIVNLISEYIKEKKYTSLSIETIEKIWNLNFDY